MSASVIIAGGGIGGLTLAGLLQQSGRTCVILERRMQLAEEGAGLALWPNAMAVLDALKIRASLETCSTRLCHTRLQHWKGKLLKSVPVEQLAAHFGFPGLTTARADLLSALYDGLLDKDALRFGASYASVETTDGGVRVTLEDGGVVEGVCLVGADGLWSKVRTGNFSSAAPLYVGRTSWRGLVDLGEQSALLPPQSMIEALGPGQRVGLVHAGGRRAYWYVQVCAKQGQYDAYSAAPKSLLRELTKGWAAPVEAIIEATPEASMLHTDLYHLPPLRDWHQGRVVLLGDAAHAMTPDLGQGACQAILDANRLAAALCSAATPEEAFLQYQQQRRKAATTIQRASRLGGWVRQWNCGLARWGRDLVLRCVPASVVLRGLRRVISLSTTPASLRSGRGL